MDNLQDMVVVVDDTNTESGKGPWGKGGGGLSLLLGVSQILQEKVNLAGLKIQSIFRCVCL